MIILIHLMIFILIDFVKQYGIICGRDYPSEI